MSRAPSAPEVGLVLGAALFAPHLLTLTPQVRIQRRRETAGGAFGDLAPRCISTVGIIISFESGRLGFPGH